MSAKIYSPTPVNLRRLAGVLREGGLVALPTETVYGLAANALDARACQAIFSAKGRPTQDPLIVHVLDLAHAEELATFHPLARRLARRFWPGPLTLVLPKKICIPDIVTADRATVAIRSPAHPLTRQLLRRAGIPLAAPSANPFGYISPTTAAHVRDSLGKKISYILNGGACSVGVESTILDLTNPAALKILRPGAITAADIRKFLGAKISLQTAKLRRPPQSTGQLAPGLLPQHYSPHTPLLIKSAWSLLPPNVAGIYLRRPQKIAGPNCLWLSQRGDGQAVAKNLYQVLRQADQGGYRQIWIEALPADADGLAAAINDRLQRAATKR